MARSRKSRPLVWTSLVRLPEDIGAFVDQCAAAELTPPAVLLRRWIAERVDQERGARPAPALDHGMKKRHDATRAGEHTDH